MKFNVYYKSDKQKYIHKIEVTTDDHVIAIADVKEYISINNTNVVSPVLAVIEGGKNGTI